MAALKKSEKRLLAVFLAVVFLVCNFFLYTQLAAVQRRAEQTVEMLELERMEIDDLLLEKETWDQRAQWLGQMQPGFTSRDQVDQDLLNAIREAARNNSVQLESEELPEPEDHPLYVQAVAKVKGAGDLQSILKWIFQLQKPHEFRAVTFFELKPEKDDPSVIHCEVQVERWYAPRKAGEAGGTG